jgi:hypothetical protein
MKNLLQSHAVPVFEGTASHRHERRPVWKLRLEALRELLRFGGFAGCKTYVQFAGFPRSGHSLVGSILDAHADALVAHELDAMGLFKHGLSAREVFALIRRNTRTFEAHGRYWNGHSYQVPGGHGGRAVRARVVGDKKGDWAVRHSLANPELLATLGRRTRGRRRAWIAVVRNPFDNIATMSLRKGRTYDRLRIDTPDPETFETRLREAQGQSVAADVRGDVVDDYIQLCQGVERLRAQVPESDWLLLRHEDLVADPDTEIDRLARFLDLPNGEGLAAKARAIVASEPNRSRHKLNWPEAERDRVNALIRDYSFLHGYRFDD